MNDKQVLEFYSEAENHFKALADSYDRLADLHREAGNFTQAESVRERKRRYREMQNYAHENVVTLKQLMGI